MQNPRITPKQACLQLRISYHKHGHTVRTYLSEFRCQYENSAGAYWAKNLPHWRRWEWNKVEMTEQRLSEALSNGWRNVKNKNGMRQFKSSEGSVQWYPGGSVVICLRGSSNLGRAKGLFCLAFSWLSDSEKLSLCEGSFREVGRHWVFDQEKPMPRFSINQFQKSHGLRIYSDGSHPTAIEAEETVPLYLQNIITAQNLLAQNLRSHLELIENWKREAEERAAALSMNRNLSGEGFWRRFWAVMTTPL